MDEAIKVASDNDILRWPDGTACYRSQWAIGHYACMGDDFEVITADSPEYAAVEAGGMGPGASFQNPGPAAAPEAAPGLFSWCTRPLLPAGAAVWRVGDSLQRKGPPPLCPRAAADTECPSWRKCYNDGCQRPAPATSLDTGESDSLVP